MDVFEIKDKDLAGRIGILRTRSGDLRTPAFFPVVDPQKQLVALKELEELGFRSIITNAYLLWKRYGKEVAEKGIHRFLGFEGVVMTDSGAYQILRYGNVDIDNRTVVEFQCLIGSDIGVILDVPTSYDVSFGDAKRSVEITLSRAREVQELVTSCSETLWVLPIQGGVYTDLVRFSATEAAKLTGYSMYGIGSPVTVMEGYMFDKLVEMIVAAKSVLPPDAPVHLFGAGHPAIIPFIVALGVDTFDSASYMLYARDERYMTESGTMRLGELDEFPCECSVCSRYTPDELREMSYGERVKLLALHNLHMIMRELKRTRVALREGRLWEYLEAKSRMHPALKRAFDAVRRFYRFLEMYDVDSKGVTKAVLLYSLESVQRPRIIRRRRRIEDMGIPPWASNIVVLPGLPFDKPYSDSALARYVREVLGKDYLLVFMAPPLGAVTELLTHAYPWSQHESKYSMSVSEVEDAVGMVMEVIVKSSRRLGRVVVVDLKECEWCEYAALRIATELRSVGIEPVILSIKCSDLYRDFLCRFSTLAKP